MVIDKVQEDTKSHSGKSTVLLEMETDQGDHSASSLESKLLFCTRDDVKKPRVAKSGKSSILDKKPHIGAVPESDVLGKVKNFLGVIAEANKSLQADEEGGRKYDMEMLNGNETELIEMDLMLGVADLHTPEAVAAAESAMAGNQPTISLAAGDSSDDDDDDDSSDSGEVDDEDDDDSNSNCEDFGGSDNGEKMSKTAAESSSKAARKQPLKKRPKIVELS